MIPPQLAILLLFLTQSHARQPCYNLYDRDVLPRQDELPRRHTNHQYLPHARRLAVRSSTPPLKQPSQEQLYKEVLELCHPASSQSVHHVLAPGVNQLEPQIKPSPFKIKRKPVPDPVKPLVDDIETQPQPRPEGDGQLTVEGPGLQSGPRTTKLPDETKRYAGSSLESFLANMQIQEKPPLPRKSSRRTGVTNEPQSGSIAKHREELIQEKDRLSRLYQIAEYHMRLVKAKESAPEDERKKSIVDCVAAKAKLNEVTRELEALNALAKENDRAESKSSGTVYAEESGAAYRRQSAIRRQGAIRTIGKKATTFPRENHESIKGPPN